MRQVELDLTRSAGDQLSNFSPDELHNPRPRRASGLLWSISIVISDGPRNRHLLQMRVNSAFACKRVRHTKAARRINRANQRICAPPVPGRNVGGSSNA
jgi:hypothetical protein